MNILHASKAQERLRAWFPEREFFMRSDGQVRFIKLTSRLQVAVAGAVLAIMAGLGTSAGAISYGYFANGESQASLLARQAQVSGAEARLAGYRDDVAAMTSDLQRRQAFLEEMTQMLPADAVEPELEAPEPHGGAGKALRKISAVVPEASALARVEAQQFALVDRLTRYADRRAERTEAAIRKLGLNPRTMLAAARTAQGGPLQRLSTERDGSVDPRFERLGASLARMDALERGLTGIPQVMPADRRLISSGFGYRSDPFTGDAALHSGLDFAGKLGAPIHAAAAGRVSFVGTKSGYGTVVEISHGNGLLTRYAHMSSARARAGQDVAAGQVIGAIGSTGRSTGPHLHFEVRIDDRAVNPRPFLEAAPEVLQAARAT